MAVVALDFDGVMHKYSKGWQKGQIYDPPVESLKEALVFLAARYRVVVYTARTASDLKLIWNWLYEHGLHRYVSEVTFIKPKAKLYVDDRAYRFTGSWTEEKLEEIERLMEEA